MGKVNGYPKGIGLGNIFRSILWEKKKVTEFFFLQLFIFLIKVVLKFS